MTYNPSYNTFRNRQPLTIDALHRIVPSAFATEAHESRSDRYIYIPTYHVLEALYKDGWRAYSAGQSRTRDPERGAYTKHTIMLRHPDMLPLAVDDVFPEMRLTNAHDGRSAYRLSRDVFRAKCLNGMCFALRGFEDVISVKHSGVLDRIKREVVEGSHRIIDGGALVSETINKMADARLTPMQARLFAGDAAALAWDSDTPPVQPEQLLRERRHDDRGDDIWRTFNRVQENIIKGGLSGRNSNGGRTTTREVRSIDRDERLNRGLFKLAADYRVATNGTEIERLDFFRAMEAERAAKRREAERQAATEVEFEPA